MLNIICVCTGDNDIHEGVFNKLQMFEKFTIDYNIYFDLDVIIRGDCNKFISQALSVINAWWRPAYHTPINSSIISWYGNKSYIYKDFMKQPDYYMVKYNKGMDQYLYENHEHITFPEGGVCSYQTILDEREFSVYLFNQMYKSMQSLGWYSKYLLPQFVTHWQHYQDESQSQPL